MQRNGLRAGRFAAPVYRHSYASRCTCETLRQRLESDLELLVVGQSWQHVQELCGVWVLLRRQHRELASPLSCICRRRLTARCGAVIGDGPESVLAASRQKLELLGAPDGGTTVIHSELGVDALCVSPHRIQRDHELARDVWSVEVSSE
jgi:hypothetical protein